MREICISTLLLLSTTLLLSCILLLQPDTAHSEMPQWSGSIKTLNIYGKEAPADLFPDYQLSSNQARLNSVWSPVDDWQFEAALDYQYFWSDPSGIVNPPDIRYNRLVDLDKVKQHGDHAFSSLQVDRLNLQWSSGAMDTTLGRQALGFGRILIYSPLDVIAPFAPDAIDTEVRRGVDALHTIYNYGLDGQLGAVAVWGEKARYDSYLATWSDNRSGLDLLMIGGRLRGHNMFGAGVAGSLGTLGLKGEFSLHKGRDTEKPGGDLHDVYALAAIESWYRFDNGISLIFQYLYNGPGVNEPHDYPKVIDSPPLQEGLTHLLGKHYLIAAPSYELHPLATVQGLLLYNLGDDSALIRPTLDLSLSDNLFLQLFWTWYAGQEPRVTSSLPVELRSEFGMRADSGGLLLKWFF